MYDYEQIIYILFYLKCLILKKIYLDAFRKGKQQCIKLIILKRTHMCNDMTHNVTMYKSDITVNRNGNE